MTMPTNIRLSKQEQEDLRKKAIEINKLLISKGKEPLKDSEIVHIILEKSITYVKVNKEGELYIEPE